MSRKKTKWTDEELGWLERRQAKPEEYWHEIEQLEGEEIFKFLGALPCREFLAFMAKFYPAKLTGRVSKELLFAVEVQLMFCPKYIIRRLSKMPEIQAIMERRRMWETEDAMGVGR